MKICPCTFIRIYFVPFNSDSSLVLLAPPFALYVYRIVPPFAKVKTFYYCCKLFPFTFYTTFTHVSRIADEIGMIYPRLQSILSKSFAPPSVLNNLYASLERRFESV